MILSEVLYNEEAHKVGYKLDNLQATDSKSLCDAIIAANPNQTDKRSLANVRAIREAITPKQTRWVPTRLLYAGGFTKLNATLRLNLMRWLQNPLAQLTDGKTDGSKKNFASDKFRQLFYVILKGSRSLSDICQKRCMPCRAELCTLP